MNNDFVIQKPSDIYLQSLVEYYFFIDISVEDLKLKTEHILPFPRITFGYFFDYPFLVTNHTLKESAKAEIVISKISTDKISIKPLTERVKILGTHIKPYALAFFTNENISHLPWLIKTPDLFKTRAISFVKAIKKCTSPKQMFEEVENAFLDTIIPKDLSTIIQAVELIEKSNGNICISDISKEMGISGRTLRNHFYRNIGCSPKEYIHLLKVKQIVQQMKDSDDLLTSISYSQNYSDQAHFTNSVKNITGFSPKEIRKKIPDFRFLQF
ncbi:MAG: AraC family transcriptional regulator [Bacteroidota bacterium]